MLLSDTVPPRGSELTLELTVTGSTFVTDKRATVWVPVLEQSYRFSAVCFCRGELLYGHSHDVDVG